MANGDAFVVLAKGQAVIDLQKLKDELEFILLSAEPGKVEAACEETVRIATIVSRCRVEKIPGVRL